MTKLRFAGFFRELTHGDLEGPSLAEAREVIPLEKRERIARYLERGAVLVIAGSSADDWFDPSNRRVAQLAVRTDGEWAWSGDLAYYVARYGVAIPDELEASMERNGWEPPPLTREQIRELLVVLRAGSR